MDRFVEYTSSEEPGCERRLVMGYFDGNTVTALWNYAQHYAMSDNSFGTGFGPSDAGRAQPRLRQHPRRHPGYAGRRQPTSRCRTAA